MNKCYYINTGEITKMIINPVPIMNPSHLTRRRAKLQVIAWQKEREQLENYHTNERTHFENPLKKYLKETALHGLRYIGDSSLSKVERLGFGLIFIFVTIVAGYFISNVWKKWNNAPLIIGLNPVATEIKDIPFPAITICNMNQAKKSIAINIKR